MSPRAHAAGLALCLALGLAACAEERPREIAAKAVTVTTVEMRDMEEAIEATGQLIARDKAQIAAEVDGRITDVVLEEGDWVEPGVLLLEIDPERRQLDFDNAAARLAEAQAMLVDAEREVRRVVQLHRRSVASQAQLEDAETALQTAQSRVAAARASTALTRRALRDASLRAPFAGRIAKRYVSTGEFVKVGQPLFELVSLDPIEAEFHLAEVDSGRVQLAQEVTVQVAPHPDELFGGVVTVVSPTIDSRTRTLRVRAALPNPDGRLRPGLFARVNVGLSRRENVMMIPEEAVLQRADGAVVFRLNGKGSVERRIVEVGVHEYGAVEIRSGLAMGDAVVTRGHADLADGSPVVVRNPDGTARTPAVASGPAEDPP
jgi:membrane fusion protein (multidrug efflux system)